MAVAGFRVNKKADVNAQSLQQTTGMQPKGIKLVAEIISHILHPVFFPLLMALAVYQITPGAFAGTAGKQVGLWFISITVTAVLFHFSVLH